MSGFISIQPANTGAIPAEPMALTAKMDIGKPRLRASYHQRMGREVIFTDSFADQISAMVPPTMVAPVEPKEPCKNRASNTTLISATLHNIISNEKVD